MEQAFSAEEEVLSGYKVSREMKALWNIEADILQKFDEVCKKHNLKWFAIGGTLLGAIRHQGFIPWDDDMDVGMLQEDYDKFCEIGPSEFQEPYFFQLHRTDSYAAPWQVKIRRSDTTGATTYEKETMPEGYNKGIFFDVFPLTNIPDSEKAQRRLEKQLLRRQRIIQLKRRREGTGDPRKASRAKGIRALVTTALSSLLKLVDYNSLCDRYLKRCYRWKDQRTERVGLIAPFPGNPRLIWRRSAFDRTESKPFGKAEVIVPSEYDEILTAHYGDYMTPVMGTQVHTQVILSVDTPFAEYFRQRPEA